MIIASDAGGEHHRVADRLDKSHQCDPSLTRQLREPACNATQLFGRERFTETGEADDIGETHGEAERTGWAGRDTTTVSASDARPQKPLWCCI